MNRKKRPESSRRRTVVASAAAALAVWGLHAVLQAAPICAPDDAGVATNLAADGFFRVGACGCANVVDGCEDGSICVKNQCYARCLHATTMRRPSKRCACSATSDCLPGEFCDGGDCVVLESDSGEEAMIKGFVNALAKDDAIPPSSDAITVLMSFPASQLSVARFNLDLWESTHKPCVVATPHTLVFYSPNDADSRQTRESLGARVPRLRTCFADVEFKSANVIVNDYEHRGDAFYALFEDVAVRGYLFWMEPDTFPLVEDWLVELEKEVMVMKYAKQVIRGPSAISSSYSSETDRLHINGNALYNMDSYVLRYMISESRTLSNSINDYLLYDAAIKYSSKNKHEKITIPWLSMYGYTRSIVNHATRCDGGDAIFAHGAEAMGSFLEGGAQCCESPAPAKCLRRLVAAWKV